MSKSSSLSPQLLALGWLLGCGPGEDAKSDSAPELGPCDTGIEARSWAGWGQGFFRTYCGACHAETSLDRNGAPDGVFFDTEAQVWDQSAVIRRVVLEDGTMPIGGGVVDEDLVLLARFLDCGIEDGSQ